jgi:galactokinase
MSDFNMLFGAAPTITAEAPGRVNLIGEHTDYNAGFVLPTAIPQRTHVELLPRDGAQVRVWSDAAPQPVKIESYTLGSEKPRHDWFDYIQGVTFLLTKERHAIGGFDARITSTVPLGSGLSSSASLTVSLQRGLRAAFRLALDDVAIARLGQRVENEFVGAHVGIMDPMAASLADERTALFLDCQSLTFERVALPEYTDLAVIHSGVVHDHAAGDYNTRRRECEEACRLLGVRQLRDCGPLDLDRIATLPEPLNRRARHVVTEDERVVAAVATIRAKDLEALGQLFYASHASMRDDYQVSVKEVDLIVDLARAEKTVFGARLTGGGFGGSVVLLIRAGFGRATAERIAESYMKHSNYHARLLVPQ